ncbi:hypothetical protein EJ02DRAFT_371575 [Clathrospora elynae]|uniref:Peptidase S54 rhomboid domain-containing protein n=1 Tax=Clathrospora elynae TaxID=706981 RepID=A0A6A5SUI7_9PLEO|nr:hypothetical protein EJ02DRAFT_371575 [Clathrospora elynae]
MSMFSVGGAHLRCFSSRTFGIAALRPTLHQLRGQFQARGQHNNSQNRSPISPRQQLSRHTQRPQREIVEEDLRSPLSDEKSSPGPYPIPKPRQGLRQGVDNSNVDELLKKIPKVKVRYLRPAIWAVVVSSSIYVGLAYLEAKEELKPKTKLNPSGGWLQAPQRGPPTPTETAINFWNSLNSISKLSYGIIAANSAVHLSSLVVPRFWDTLWHLPARNVNYTQFSSMFVHSGVFHFGVNMYFLNNFMTPVGYSRLFEGSPYHTLSFFLSAGVLSGFAQHWSTLIPIQKRAIPEIFIRCGGASGALFGVLGVFCMQYPHAGLGILFIPIHFDAQSVLPAIMLFDFIGMVRGYSFVNFGHAAHFSGALLGVAYSYFDGKTNIWKPLVGFWKRRLQQ